MNRILGLSALLSLSLGSGCSGDPPPADMAVRSPSTFSEINTEVLQFSCSKFSGCHNKTYASTAGKLDLVTDPYAALVGASDADGGVMGVLSDNPKAKAEGLLRVKPGDPDHSFLVMKLELAADEDTKTGYGARMPQSNPPVDKAIIAGVRKWILEGAKKN